MRITVDPLFRVRNTKLPEHLQNLLPGFGLLHAFIMLKQTFGNLVADFINRIQTGHRILEYHGNSLSIDMAANPFLVFL